MARKTFPRPQRLHERTANEVIAKHERETGSTVSMPVPVELIIEKTMGLHVLRDDIDEPDGKMILGALAPAHKCIVLNMRHAQMFDTYLGPEVFTLAHELGHWMYDADKVEGQQTLDLDNHDEPDVFCYHREQVGLNETQRVREVNANKFAACLLMPDYLMREQDIDAIVEDLRAAARHFGVSRQALQYRLDALGLVDDTDRLQFET